MYITLTCVILFLLNLLLISEDEDFLLWFSAELRASRESGTKWWSCEVGYRCWTFPFLPSFSFILTLLEDICFPHTLLVFMYYSVEMNYSVLKYEDQIMKTFLKNKILESVYPLFTRNSRMGIKLSTFFKSVFRCATEIGCHMCIIWNHFKFSFHKIPWIWSRRKLLRAGFWIVSLLHFQ